MHSFHDYVSLSLSFSYPELLLGRRNSLRSHERTLRKEPDVISAPLQILTLYSILRSILGVWGFFCKLELNMDLLSFYSPQTQSRKSTAIKL